MTPYRTQCQECDVLRKEVENLKEESTKTIRLNSKVWLKASAVVAGAVYAAIIGGHFLHAVVTKPDAPEVCRDAAEIVTVGNTQRSCAVGASISTEVLPKSIGDSQQVLVRCKCPLDGGAQ